MLLELAWQCTQMADVSYAEMLGGSSNDCVTVGILGALERKVMEMLLSPSSSSETREYVLGNLPYYFLEVPSRVEQYTQSLQCTPSLLSVDEYRKPFPN